MNMTLCKNHLLLIFISIILVGGSISSSSIIAIASAIINPSFGKTTTTPIKHLVVISTREIKTSK
jgi:hypothetical protein